MSSGSSASRIVGEEAVPLRGPALSEPEVVPEGEPGTTVIEEEPVPLRLGSERVEAEEREARLSLLTGRRSWGRASRGRRD